jgi:hypothetical protein
MIFYKDIYPDTFSVMALGHCHHLRNHTETKFKLPLQKLANASGAMELEVLIPKAAIGAMGPNANDVIVRITYKDGGKHEFKEFFFNHSSCDAENIKATKFIDDLGFKVPESYENDLKIA